MSTTNPNRNDNSSSSDLSKTVKISQLLKRKSLNSYRQTPDKEPSSQIQKINTSINEKKSLFQGEMTPREKQTSSISGISPIINFSKESFKSATQFDFSNLAKNVSVTIPFKFM